jgi:hypothetical protein
MAPVSEQGGDPTATLLCLLLPLGAAWLALLWLAAWWIVETFWAD